MLSINSIKSSPLSVLTWHCMLVCRTRAGRRRPARQTLNRVDGSRTRSSYERIIAKVTQWNHVMSDTTTPRALRSSSLITSLSDVVSHCLRRYTTNISSARSVWKNTKTRNLLIACIRSVRNALRATRCLRAAIRNTQTIVRTPLFLPYA